MKTYIVKVGFLGSERTKVLYSKQYRIVASSPEEAKIIVTNGLNIIEFHNFVITEVREIEC